MTPTRLSTVPALIVVLVVAFGLAGCSTTQQLESQWTAEGSSQGLPPRGVTLVVDGDRISGSDGCNAYFGKLSVQDFSGTTGRLVVGDVTSTLIGCPAEVQQVADWFMRLLHDRPTFVVDGNRLTLRADDGRELVLVRA
ncbi:META domain-containing protein [Propionibacteriaceae bacterium G1746]|uniref:META domain-containing protein n=1 Tax=Aestuariimicrobium sp. G57 TaxID=3418485 RepID=UPI003C1328F7